MYRECPFPDTCPASGTGYSAVQRRQLSSVYKTFTTLAAHEAVLGYGIIRNCSKELDGTILAHDAEGLDLAPFGLQVQIQQYGKHRVTDITDGRIGDVTDADQAAAGRSGGNGPEVTAIVGGGAITSIQWAPLSSVYSIFTSAIVPIVFQAMFCVVPASQLSPPSGEITTMSDTVPGGQIGIVNIQLEINISHPPPIIVILLRSYAPAVVGKSFAFGSFPAETHFPNCPKASEEPWELSAPAKIS